MVYTKHQAKESHVLKVVVIIAAIVGIFLSVYAEKDSFMSGANVFMYFTIQSNILIAIISALGFYYMKKDDPGKVWPIVMLVATVAITLTGFVFCFVLAPTLGSETWRIKNILTHVVVPVAAIADFFVVGRKFTISRKNTIFVIIPPLLYALYAGLAYIKGWQFSEGYNYPYFFLNWGSKAGAFGFTNELPFMGCMWWIIALFLFLMLVGNIYLSILTRLKVKTEEINIDGKSE